MPDPIPWEAQTERSPSHPVHCAVCNTWLPTVTILKFYHRWAAAELENIRPDNWSVYKHLDHFFMQNSCTALPRIVLYCWTLQIQLLGLASRSCKVTITRKLPPVAEVLRWVAWLVGRALFCWAWIIQIFCSTFYTFENEMDYIDWETTKHALSNLMKAV